MKNQLEIKPLLQSLSQQLLLRLLVLWISTLRIRWETTPPRSPCVIGLWHQDLPACMAVFAQQQVLSLISPSRDGDLAAGVAQAFAVSAIRGSSSRGFLAIRALLLHLEKGKSVGMALDGPRGPAQVEKPGAQWIARRAQVPLARVHLRYGWPVLRLNSWDRTCLPLPFCPVYCSVYCGRS